MNFEFPVTELPAVMRGPRVERRRVLVGGSACGDHSHSRTSEGKVMNRVKTTGSLRARKKSISARLAGMVARASATSRAAPTRTKSFCMSTTSSAGLR